MLFCALGIDFKGTQALDALTLWTGGNSPVA